MAADRLSISLQENLLVLLCFSANSAPIVRNTIAVRLFGQQLYRDVVTRVYDYFDRYKAPPGEHLPDLFDDILEKDSAESKELAQLLTALHGQREQVNEKYAMDQLERFVRQQTLKSSIIAASEAIQENDLDGAEKKLQEGLQTRLQLFQPGSLLEEGLAKAFAGKVRRDVLNLNIPELDKAHLGPGRGELHVLIGPPKRGKSWWLVHVSKSAILQRLHVLYLTLELSEWQIHQRHLQAFFSLTRHKEKVQVSRLRKDDLGRLFKVERETLAGRLSFDEAASKPQIERKLQRLYGRENLLVKQFPANELTVAGIDAYLDMLEQSLGFVPDVLVLDYAKYLQIKSPQHYRLELGAIFNDLRGLAVRRDMAVVTAHASNREGAKAATVREEHSGEDYSVIFTADTVVTYSQTPAEKALGLARLLASNTRVADRDGFTVLLSQAYQVGQFALDSVLMQDTYRGLMEQAGAQAGDEADEE